MSTTIIIITIVLVIIVIFIGGLKEYQKISKMTPKEKEKYLAKKEEETNVSMHGNIASKIHCPHCQEQGYVHTKLITQKKGISGTKATGALLTGGISLFVTGLSRKEAVTEAYCSNCKQTWHF